LTEAPTSARRPRVGRYARLTTYSVVGALAVAAVAFIRPIPPSAPAAAVLAIDARPPAWLLRTDTLGRGETIGQLLERSGIGREHANRIIRSLTSLDDRKTPAGMPITVRRLESDSLPREIVFQLAIDRLLHVERVDSSWVSREERLPWTTDTIVVSAVVHSTLYDALDQGGGALPRKMRSELAWAVADIFEYRVDMSRDLQDGDSLKVLVERSSGPGGAVRVGSILAARLTLSGATTEALRYTVAGRERYFDQAGRALQASFLRAPVAFRRISSVFGMRLHPILGIWRKHAGTDYAASSGTPVRSIGEGVVVFAGRQGGYGNVIEVRHPNGFVTRYGHLRGFARGARSGARVGIGQTIGFVGMTGLATAPHLHFEVLVNGVQKNPRVALGRTGGEPLGDSERLAFAERRVSLLARLDGTETFGVVTH
jgi:murein DD-endopeptidase MepM/ murein hydrolase activator NlpD